MSFKPLFSEYKDFANPVGNAAVDTSRSYVDPDLAVLEFEENAKHALNWGDYLRPRHFQFEEGTPVCSRGGLRCTAVSVLGSGWFKETDASQPDEFLNGAVLVKANNRVKLFLFEDFQRRFVLENGKEFESIYQIDFQTPKK